MKPWFWNGKEKPKHPYLEYTCRFPGACQKHMFVGFIGIFGFGLFILIAGILIALFSVKSLWETVPIVIGMVGMGLTVTIGMGYILFGDIILYMKRKKTL